MVLMSDTGGGHRASAEALQAGFEQLYGNDFQVTHPSCLWPFIIPVLTTLRCGDYTPHVHFFVFCKICMASNQVFKHLLHRPATA